MKRKKILTVLLSCLLCLCCMAFGVGCGGGNDSGNGGSNIESGSGNSSGDSGEKPAEKVTVTYNANGGTFAGGGSTQTVTVDEDSTLVAPDAPTRVHYTFAGWAKNSLGTDMWNFATDKVTGNVTLYATWSQESATILSVDGASIEELKIFMLVDKDTDSVSLANKVVCTDDSVWRLYYDKLGQVEIPTKIVAGSAGALLGGDNIFYIVVTSQNGAQVNVYELNVHRSHAVAVNYYDGEELLKTETAYTGEEFSTDYVPEIKGYTFNGWKDYAAKVLWEGLDLYADTTVNTYKVTYDENGGDKLSESDLTVTYDKTYELAKPTRTGYTFLGWYNGEEQLTDDRGEGLTEWAYDVDVTAVAKWQANEYSVTLNKTQGGSVSGGGEHSYDSKVTVTAMTDRGYIWLGWYDKDDALVSSELSYEFTMGFDVSYTAKWSKVAVVLERRDVWAGGVSFLNGTYVNGQDVTVTAETNSGYVWLGWYSGEMLLTEELSYTFKMTVDSAIYTAKWCKVETEKNIEAAGTATALDGKYVKGQEVTVTAETNPGYMFLGWYNGETLLTEETSYTFKMPAENVTYTAKWKELTALKNFEFTYEGDVCVITGVKDKTVTEIVVPDYVTSIAKGAFAGCSNLEKITIPFVGDAVGKTASDSYQYPFGYIFGENSYTGSTKVSQSYYGPNPNSVTSSNYYIPTGLTAVTVTGGDILYSAFRDCDSLTSVTLGDGVKSIGAWAFRECSNLTNVAIGNGVTSIGKEAFYNCQNLATVAIGNSVEIIDELAFQHCYDLKRVVIPDSVKSIEEEAFGACSGLTDVKIGNGVTSIGDSAFNGCSSLKNFAFGTAVESIGKSAFEGCRSLESMVIPDYVTSMGDSVFKNCSNLTAVTIGKGITAIGKEAFYVCSKLTGIELPDGVTSIGDYAFGFCEELSSLSIGKNVQSIGVGAFESCLSLVSVVIPEKVTSVAEYTFSNCSGLASVVIGDGVTSIGRDAFSNCSGLLSVVIGDGVTNIGYYAFSNCSSLTSVVVGVSVTSIESLAFYNCGGLANAYYKGTAESWDKITMGDYNFNLMGATRYYYSESAPTETTESGKYWRYVDGVPTVWTYNTTAGKWE